jgi:hypothetical protein
MVVVVAEVDHMERGGRGGSGGGTKGFLAHLAASALISMASSMFNLTGRVPVSAGFFSTEGAMCMRGGNQLLGASSRVKGRSVRTYGIAGLKPDIKL